MNVVGLLTRSALRAPASPAVIHGEALLHDYAGLASRCARLAAGLRSRLGLRAGDRVAVWAANCPEYLEVLHAVWWCGAVAVPVNAKLHPQELAWILADCGARLLFVSRDGPQPDTAGTPGVRTVGIGGAQYAGLLADAPATPWPAAPGDPAWLFYTSGTTGRPKGVTLTHRNLLAMTACFFTDVDAADARDAAVYAAPMSHGAGLYALPYLLRGARHLLPESGGFEPEELLGLSRRIGRLAMFAAPTMVRRLVDAVAHAGADASGFRTVVYGGGPMYVEDIRRALDTMGPRFVQIYGQGESPMTITALSREALADREHPRWLERLASVGTAQSLVEVRVADAQGRALPAGETGEVLVRGDTVMAGYWGAPQASARALRDGWLWTGDLGALDAEGFLTLKDRSKDMVITGGSNVYPREVEEVLLAHPAVTEVAVVGEPDPEWGETVVAFVVAPPTGPAVAGALEAELDALCLSRIARFKRPKRYVLIDALPKNHYGKVLKTELRALLAAGA
jgi:long-chain acyl-CoA synthetase